MAVAVELVLPDQPGIGVNQYIPLGGDGWTAPHSVAEFSISSAGDASAGNNVITLNFDPRFISVVSYVRLANSSASTALEMSLTMFPTGRSQPQVQAFANAVPVIGMFGNQILTWCPPPLPHLGSLQGATPNINGDTLSIMGWIYQFQINVLQKVPLNIILASLPRSDSQYPVTGA